VAEREVAVVTGASGGIGRATAREFARHGAVGRLARGRAGLDAAAREVRELGGEACPCPTDVDDFEAVRNAAAVIVVKGQQTDQVVDRDRPSNLFEPLDGEHDEGAHGIFDDQAHGRSAQAWLSRHRRASTLGGAAALAVAGALVLRSA
jgi:nucleoside-diphosphate-sugar epimerase